MDVQKYIQSGVLEQYCLGQLNEHDQAYLIQLSMLYPEIKQELDAVEITLEALSFATAVAPSAQVKRNILASLGFDNEVVPLDLNNLPTVDKNTDYFPWLETLGHLIPDEPTEDFIIHTVRQDEKIQQMLVITKNNVPEEEHGDYLESFFILKGRCECTVGDELFTLNAGDFLEIPLHVKHDIKIVTPYVVGILQYQFV